MRKNQNDLTDKEVLLGYKKALSSMGISELIRLLPEDSPANYQSIIADYVVKAIWYSRQGTDAHRQSAASLLYGKNFIKKEGTLGDMILLMQLIEVVDQLEKFEKYPVTVNSLKTLRGTLIKNLFGNSKYGPGLRRYRNSTGPYITEPMESMSNQLKKTISLLNTKHEDPTEAFMNGIQFYAEFIKIHPFEDTDGRTARLLYNWYAIKNRIRAIHISEEFKDMYTEVLHPYYLSGYIGSAVTSMLLLTLTPTRIDRLKKLMKREETDSLTIVELKALLKASLNMADPEELGRDVSRLFEARSEKKNYSYAALWLCNLTNLDHEVIRRAYEETEDPKLRVLAVNVMSKINYQKYKDLIMGSLLKDPDENVRAQAVMQIGLKGDINKIHPKIIESEKSALVLMTLGKALTFVDGHGETEPNMLQKTIKRLMADEEPNVRLRGYQAFAARSGVEEITGMLAGDFLKIDSMLQKEVIVELNRTNRLNTPQISRRLSELAKDDITIKQHLLGELGIKGVSGNGYESLFRHILSTNGHTDGERAHAIYLLGKQKGYDYLCELKELLGPVYSKLEKLAVALVYLDSLESTNGISPPKHTLNDILPSGSSLEIMAKVALAIEVSKSGHDIDNRVLSVLTEGNTGSNPFGMVLRGRANGETNARANGGAMETIFNEIVRLCTKHPEPSTPTTTLRAEAPRSPRPRMRLN